jgi:RNA polymerase sigma-70 factor (ECF subfamily)
LVIAQRRFVDRMRHNGATSGREVPLAPEHETIAAPAANPLIEEWSGRALRAAIDALPEGQRQAIQLLKLKEMSLKEASAATGMSVAALKVASHRAIKRLRELLRAGDVL